MQSNVSVCTSENDINVILGPAHVSGNLPSREFALAAVKYLYADINDIRQNYFRLGFHLHEFEVNKYYLNFGYASLSDFAGANLGMDSSAVSRCLSVFERFSKKNDFRPTMIMQEEYEKFSYSQLVEMVSVHDEKVFRQITPDMSIRQIRDLKKLEKMNNSQIATSQNIKKFDYSHFIELKGSPSLSYIKSLDPIGSTVLYVFSRDGKMNPDVSNMWVDVLEDVKTADLRRIVLRV